MHQWDEKWGEQVSSHSRGQPLSDLIKVFQVLVVQITDQIEYMNALSAKQSKDGKSRQQTTETLMKVVPDLHRQSFDLIRAIFGVLHLRIPCYWKKDNHWNMIEERCVNPDDLLQLIEGTEIIPRICLRKLEHWCYL